MKLVVIYRDKSDHARRMIEFLTLFKRRYPQINVEELEIDSREGTERASLYGVVDYPVLLSLGATGNVIGMWEGIQLPLIDEVASSLLVS
jgi:hypothetical protein